MPGGRWSCEEIRVCQSAAALAVSLDESNRLNLSAWRVGVDRAGKCGRTPVRLPLLASFNAQKCQ